MKYWKTAILLTLVAALLTGILLGCSSEKNGADSIWIDIPEAQSPTLSISASPNDTYYAVDLQWAAEIMELEKAWDISTGSSTIRVGVIDSGVDITHPDLQNRVNVALSESFISGYSPFDDQPGHGTHVAGIIGAQGNNGIGVTGVCWDVEIVSLRATNEYGQAPWDAVINAINSANSKGIHILNISICGTADSNTILELEAAINNFEGLVVCAAGNLTEATPDLNNDSTPVFPCCAWVDNLICVGASTNADTMWEYSHYGANSVDIFAPGSSIFNCYSTSECGENCNSSTTHIVDDYHLLSGTSMAAPQVAGVAALMLAIHPELSAAELKAIIMENVSVIFDNDGNDVFGSLCVSGGRLNAYKALSSASLHTFGNWHDVTLTYHERHCTICGYIQKQAHSEHWSSARNKCIACGRTGPIPINPLFVPIEESEFNEMEIIERYDVA